MTPGGAQTLVKSQRVLPGSRIVLAGSGPFLLPVATTLIEAGAKIVGIFEATTPREWAQHAPRLWGHWERARGRYATGAPSDGARADPLRSHRGTRRRRRVRRARRAYALRPRRRVVERTELVEDADTLCVSYGFVPSVQLTRTLGCEHRHDARKGGWVPVHDEAMETSMAGVYVAGEVAGIGGAHAALAEGTLAGLSAAHRLGRSVSDSAIAGAKRDRERHRRVRAPGRATSSRSSRACSIR